MSKYQRLVIIFIAVYFGEPIITLIVGKASSLQYQLGLFLLALAVWQVLSKKIFIVTVIVCIFILAGFIHFSPHSVLLYPLTATTYALAWSALLAVTVELWESR